jgi:Reprolysin (M12B) family zinc metalloprotease
VWTDSNKISIDVSSSTNTLANFIAYKQKSITVKHDDAQFIT